MMGLLERWRSVRAELGWAPAALLLLHRCLQRLSAGRASVFYYGIYAQRIGSPSLAQIRTGSGTRTRRCDPDDAELPTDLRPASTLAQRLRERSHCYLTTVREEFAGWIWVSERRHAEDEVACDYLFPADCVWDFDVFVVPRRRFGHTFSRMWQAVDRDLAVSGFRWTMSRISQFNRASIAAHERLGAIRIGTAMFLRLGPLQLGWHLGRPSLCIGKFGRPGLHLTAPALPLLNDLT